MSSRFDSVRPGPAGRRGNILVVDDIEDNRDLLVRRLVRLGFSCFEAENGYEAFSIMKRQDFDLILLDVTMPAISGHEVLKEIRKHFDKRQLPVIMVTADAHTENIAMARALGANDYITKPVDFNLAKICIETHLNLARASMQIDDARRDLRLARQGHPSAHPG